MKKVQPSSLEEDVLWQDKRPARVNYGSLTVVAVGGGQHYYVLVYNYYNNTTSSNERLEKR
jgi:hypothetical protein